MPPPLGFTTKIERTPDQERAHDAAMAHIAKTRFALQPKQMNMGDKVALYDFWKHADVVADVGFVFDRIHQITGSCVWAGGTNAAYSTIAAQRVAGENPTKAFLPMTLHNYGLSRHYVKDMSGDRSWDQPGEGSMGSTFFKSLDEDGVELWTPGQNGHPTYTHEDGISVSRSTEFQWSSYAQSKNQIDAILRTSKDHTFGSTTELKSTEDILAMIQNGYGVSFACNNFIGNAQIRGSGEDACVQGYWDNNGGHQQSIHAAWMNRKFGLLFWAQNNWPGSTYPDDPAGGPICGCWVTEANVQKALRLDAEVFAFSRLDWFPAQPKVLNWLI